MVNIQDIQFLRQETGAGIMDCKNALGQANGNLQQSIAILQEKGFQMVKKKADRPVMEGIAYAEVYGNRAVLLEVNTETDFVASNNEFICYVEEIAKTTAKYTPNDISSLLECTIEGKDLTIDKLLKKMVLTFGENIVIRRFNILYGDMPIAYMHQNGKYGVILTLTTDNKLDNFRVYGIGKELAMQIAAMNPKFISRFHLSNETIAEIKMQIVKEIKQDMNLADKSPQLIDKIVSGKIEKFYNLNCLMEQTYIRDDSITVEQFIKQAIVGLDVKINMTEFFRYEKSEDL